MDLERLIIWQRMYELFGKNVISFDFFKIYSYKVLFQRFSIKKYALMFLAK